MHACECVWMCVCGVSASVCMHIVFGRADVHMLECACSHLHTKSNSNSECD